MILQKRNIQVFAWTYKDLRDVCEHKIGLDEGVAPVRQRHYKMNFKYSLLVKEKVGKWLETCFIYKTHINECVSPIVVYPRRMENCQFVKIYVHWGMLSCEHYAVSEKNKWK